ncbi:hypothetical protein QAD02_005705 [Eretmocerus hayati]|uniref:Uncharacterized protein n=1 Tax=Eretmocerus hayati TaxID=131215 RepID=A0ACC2NU91_9HYME|nr:hypothetical protein QAD02_005705 [Eretmocerus hayati]
MITRGSVCLGLEVAVLSVYDADSNHFYTGIAKVGKMIWRDLSIEAVDCFETRKRRMSGGVDAPDGVFSYVVSIQVHSHHVCAGTIVSPDIVLTAAHCISDGYKYTVRSGSTTWNSGGSVHEVVSFTRHQQYKKIEIKNNTLALNDLALIKVRPLMTSLDVDKVQLFGQNEMLDRKSNVTLIGWGATRKSRPGDFNFGNSWDVIKSIIVSYDKSHYFSENLKIANFKVLPKEVCASGSLTVLLEKQICAGSTFASGCKGDSGGPLMVNGRQVGIMSSCGKECGHKSSTSIFIDIASYRDWIDEHIILLDCVLDKEPPPYPIFR